MIHIAILDVDIPVPNVYATRGLYSTQFRTLLQSAATRLNFSPSSIHTTAFDTVGGQLPPLESLRTTPQTTPRRPGVDALNGSIQKDTFSTPNGLHIRTQSNSDNPLAQPIDAILITGSGAAAYQPDKYPWITPLQNFIQTVYTDFPHVKLFGSCFGHQIIARALLSSSHSHSPTSSSFPSPTSPISLSASTSISENSNPDEIPTLVKVEACPAGSEMGLQTVNLTPDFCAQFATACARLPVPNQMRLQMIHGDWVALESGATKLPAPWMNVGASTQCPVQGLYHPGKVLTYQGHFEFDVFVNRETCIEFGRRSGWDRKDIERYLELIDRGVSEGDDSEVAAEIVLEFFLASPPPPSLSS